MLVAWFARALTCPALTYSCCHAGLRITLGKLGAAALGDKNHKVAAKAYREMISLAEVHSRAGGCICGRTMGRRVVCT